MNEEKIKEIIKKQVYIRPADIDDARECWQVAEEALQEYGQYIRQQTLEEAIASVESKMCDERKVAIFNDVEFRSYQEKELANAVLNETLSNLQALKDKNK